MENEKWLPVVGYEKLYEVSNLGRIKRLPREVINPYKINFVYRYCEKIMTLTNRDGYLRISLNENGIQKRFSAHRLVAEAFLPNPKNKPHVNHKNCIRSDNWVDNLEWVTRSENILHAVRNNLIPPNIGSANGNTKLSLEKVKEIKRLLSSGKRQMDIAAIMDIDQTTVSNIKCLRTWRHVDTA